MAIAFDALTNKGLTVSPTTQAHTTAGTDRLLMAGIWMTNGDVVTSITYGGVAMTLIDKQQVGSTGEFVHMYYLMNPAVGANNFVIGWSAGTGEARIVSYTGCNQSTQPDASAKTSTTTTGDPSTSVTVVGANSWLTAFYRIQNSSDGGLYTAGVAGRNDGSSVNWGDSNTTVSTGANTVSASSDGDHSGMIAASIKVAGAAGPANLKTYNTNAKANIKSINTNLIANVKSLNTNT